MDFLKKHRVRIPKIFLAMIYIGHGAQALMISPEFVDLVMGVGFPEHIAKILVFLVGVMDISFSCYLLWTKLPQKRLLVWFALWPLAPLVLTYISGGAIEPTIIMTILFSGSIYYHYYGK